MTVSRTDHHQVALIDIGNTRMKIGWVDRITGTREHSALALEHNGVDQMRAWFDHEQVKPRAAIGVNVAGPRKAQAINDLFLHTYDSPVRWLHSEPWTAHVLNCYTDPGQLGADRWVAMIGLSQTVPDTGQPLLLASFGTATTLDTLCPSSLAHKGTLTDVADKHGTMPQDFTWTYDGGLIIPGPALMLSSLANNTAQLPQANGITAMFPTNTHQAIVTGIAAAQAGALVRQWQAGLRRYGVAPLVYGTGGGWPTIQDEAQTLLALAQRQCNVPPQPIQYLASPILDGLARLAREL